jgi:hypothetical protein
MPCNFSSYFSRNSSSEVKGTELSGIGTIIHDDRVSLEEDDAVKRVGTGTNEEVDILLGVFNDRAGTISNSSIPIQIENLRVRLGVGSVKRMISKTVPSDNRQR